jgi:hypothetical protein
VAQGSALEDRRFAAIPHDRLVGDDDGRAWREAVIPKRERKAKLPLVVGDASEPVLAPVIGARTRLIIAEVAPGAAVVAIVFADGAPRRSLR